MPKEIELEIFVTNRQGVVEAKVFKKNTANANISLISVVHKKLEERLQKLFLMSQTVSEEQQDLINQHIQYTQDLIQECIFQKINSQLLICEVGAMHYVERIITGLEGIINQDNPEYIQFKMFMEELEQIIKEQTPVKIDGKNVISYTHYDVEVIRQQFKMIFNKAKLLALSFFDEQSINDQPTERYIQDCFNNVRYLFLAKNDVNFSITK
ncbi:hypothetical protein [Legionella norrlandica]|uniref:hypothetical protein n=1 Tax=Legionella norrlandica TaxID=1498499 RepID=UPI000AF51951|nr:hypothetical protein [Legionella norrlandica]